MLHPYHHINPVHVKRYAIILRDNLKLQCGGRNTGSLKRNFYLFLLEYYLHENLSNNWCWLTVGCTCNYRKLHK